MPYSDTNVEEQKLIHRKQEVIRTKNWNCNKLRISIQVEAAAACKTSRVY